MLRPYSLDGNIMKYHISHFTYLNMFLFRHNFHAGGGSYPVSAVFHHFNGGL